MHKFFTPKELINENTAKIIGEDVKHIIKVLRIEAGEKVVLNDCQGTEYLAVISSTSKQEVEFEILEKLDINNESPVKIHLYQGLPKAQKMDLIVQKGTELGISDFIPVMTSRVDVKLKGEFKKLDRLNRIALEAAKQSKRSIVPKVLEPISFDEALEGMKQLDLIIVPYENAEGFGIKSLINKLREENTALNKISEVGIFIGPEGGFAEEEVEQAINTGAYDITLGKRILRTETAGLALMSVLMFETEE